MRTKIKTLSIQPSPQCNYNCSYCFRHVYSEPIYETSVHGQLRPFPLEVLEHTLHEYKPDRIAISGIGETSLCPNIDEVINYCLENCTGVKTIEFCTNASGRPIQWYKNLIDKCLTKRVNFVICVSLHLEANNLDECVELFNYIDSLDSAKNLTARCLVVVNKTNVENTIITLKENPSLCRHIFTKVDCTNYQDELSLKKLVLDKLTECGVQWEEHSFMSTESGEYISDLFEDTISITYRPWHSVEIKKWDSERKATLLKEFEIPFNIEEAKPLWDKTLRIKVCVPYPNHGKIHPRTLSSLQALQESKDFEIDIVMLQGSSISCTRNQGIKQTSTSAIYQNQFDFDYYLSLDADIEFTVDDLRCLLAKDLDIVGAAYTCREKPFVYVAGHFNGVEGLFEVDDFLPSTSKGLHEVDWIGGGFTLIKKEVLQKTRFPWYREEIIEYTRGDKECAQWVGEDVGFCMNARKSGFKIHVDCDCVVTHLCNEKPTLDELTQDGIDALRTLEKTLQTMYNGCKTLEMLESKMGS